MQCARVDFVLCSVQDMLFYCAVCKIGGCTVHYIIFFTVQCAKDFTVQLASGGIVLCSVQKWAVSFAVCTRFSLNRPTGLIQS